MDLVRDEMSPTSFLRMLLETRRHSGFIASKNPDLHIWVLSLLDGKPQMDAWFVIFEMCANHSVAIDYLLIFSLFAKVRSGRA